MAVLSYCLMSYVAIPKGKRAISDKYFFALKKNILHLFQPRSSVMLREATKNIILIDDHAVICAALKELIEKLGPYKISHQFNGGQDFISSVPIKPKPDLIILDISMPDMSGDEVMRKLHSTGNKTPVLVLTCFDDEEMIVRLFKLGAKGYLMKSCKAEELKKALGEIFQSGYYDNEFYKYTLNTNLVLEPSRKINNEKNVQEYMIFRIADSSSKINIKLSDILYVKSHPSGRQGKCIILKNGIKHVIVDCSFEELTNASPSLLRVNKSELISLETFEKLDEDVITLRLALENEKPKQVTLNRWFKKDFLTRLSIKR